jgi:hypothetical protein
MAVKFLGEYFSEGIAKIKGKICRGISFLPLAGIGQCYTKR